MVNTRDLHNQYNKLYAAFRNYIWDFETVECLANLEVAVYQLCPNLKDVTKYLKDLDYRIGLADIHDDELDDELEAMYATIDNETQAFCKIDVMEGVAE